VTEFWYSDTELTVNSRLVRLDEGTGFIPLTGAGSELGAVAADSDQVVTDAGHDPPDPVGVARTDPGVAELVAQLTDADDWVRSVT
jgi:hypothetical protein